MLGNIWKCVLIATAGMTLPVLNIGLGDLFIDHGTREECLQQAGLDGAGIQAQIDHFLHMLEPGSTTHNPPARIGG